MAIPTEKELLEDLFAHYDSWNPEVRAELPLQPIWMIATEEEE